MCIPARSAGSPSSPSARIYCLVPWLWHRKALYSQRLVEWHFWIATLGILLYITSMWVSGILQGLMWRAYDSLGFLEYSFVETVEAMHPFYVIRAIGGLLFLIGAVLMVYNLWRTMRGDEPVDAAEQPRIAAAPSSAPCRPSRGAVDGLVQTSSPGEELDPSC